jgi:hypothetical protein
MIELGDSPGPVKELTSRPASVTAERWCVAGHERFGVGASNCRPPNTRVQRTRSSPSARHEPLTRCPLGANRWYPARGAASVAGSRVRLCTPRASAMRADEGGEWGRAAVGRELEVGNSTLQESARPPAQSAPLWRAPGDGENNPKSRASRRNPWTRPWAGPSIGACKPSFERAPNTRMKLQAQ